MLRRLRADKRQVKRSITPVVPSPFVAVVVGLALAPGWLDAGHSEAKILGLFVVGRPNHNGDIVIDAAENDVNELASHVVWKFATGWVPPTRLSEQRRAPTREELQKSIDGLKTQMTEDDIFVFVYSGHGRKGRADLAGDELGAVGPEIDQPAVHRGVPLDVGPTRCPPAALIGQLPPEQLATYQCDEYIAVTPDRGQDIRDDELAPLFAQLPGTKVLIFNSCFSGGLAADRPQDLLGTDAPAQRGGTIVLMACGTNEYSYGSNYSFAHNGSQTGPEKFHSLFIGALLAGLEQDLQNPNPGRANLARADSNANGQVTVEEWFVFAEAQTTQAMLEMTQSGTRDLTDGKGNITVHRNATQTPRLGESAVGLAARTVVFTYDKQAVGGVESHGVADNVRNKIGFGLCGCDRPDDVVQHFSGAPASAPDWANIRCADVQIEAESPRILRLQMDVYAPIPTQPQAFFASWHFLVDIDGDRTTGHPGHRRPVGVFPDLGVDLWADLIFDGQSFRPFLFLGPNGIQSLTNTPDLAQAGLNADRTVVTMTIPIEPLEQTFSALYGKQITIAEEKIVSVAVTNYCATEPDCDDPGPPSDFFPDALYKPLLFLSLNETTLGPAGTLVARVGGRNVEPAYSADVYLGAVASDGATLIFLTSLSPPTFATGHLSDPSGFRPLVRDFLIPEGFEVALDNFFAYTFSGQEAPGAYVAFAALTKPGAFADGSNDPGDVLAIDLRSFTFSP